MTKLKFLFSLREKLSGFAPEDVEERLGFYCEMIEDRMEEGLSEEEAVAAVGDLEEIAAQIMAELPRPEAPVQTPRPKRSRKVWETVLLILGFPLWFSLLMAAFAVVFSLYVSLWAVIISFWAVFVSLVICAVVLALAGIPVAVFGNVAPGIAVLGAGLVCGGLSILTALGCGAATKGTLLLTHKAGTGVKNRFSKKEAL